MRPNPCLSASLPGSAMRWFIGQLPLLALLLLLAAGSSAAQEYEVSVIGEVQVRYGNVSITGNELNVSSSSSAPPHRAFRFLGLPYAQPPIGALRFAPPTPLDPNASGSVNATQAPPQCPHVGASQSAVSEDCLYLSVRTPNLTASLPVLVLLVSPAVNATHGDVFVATQRTVVMVTVASRQGVLGYLSLRETVNIGLQDERMALKLIRDAVRSFGGDPTRVTLGGHGAAAAAVGLHAVIEGSAGLFQQVVMFGGSIASPLAWSESPEKSMQLSRNFSQSFGCELEDLDCLRSRSVAELLNAERDTKANFVPVAGGTFFNETLRPDHLWRNGTYTGPLLIGAASESGRTIADEVAGGNWDSVTKSSFHEIIEKQFEYYPRFPTESSLEGRTFLRLIFSDFPDRKFGSNSRPLVTQAIGDYRFLCPVLEAASDLVRADKGPVFMFLHETLDSMDRTNGHVDDAWYFLGGPLAETGYSEKHHNLSKTMMQHLAAFVTSNATDIWSRLSLSGSEFMHYKVLENASVAETKLGGFGLVPGRCPLWKHELSFLSKISAFDSFGLSRESPIVTVGGKRDIADEKRSSRALTIVSNYTVGVIGFGQVTGQTIRTDAGVTMSQFLGIRYAKPPVGDLRFAKPAALVTTSATVHLALLMPPLGLQRDNLGLPMSEDCLFLNLWTPMHAGQSASNLPVFVFLHGGFFQLGGISEDQWHGSRMLDHERAVVITVSYRLGVFGFLSLDNDSVPGNFGLRDQELALDWVLRNVDKFGGSRSKITLIGVEAGAVSVGYHMARPQPRFQRAVMLSGSPYMTYLLSDSTQAVHIRNRIFSSGVLGCSENDTLSCLRNNWNATQINEKQQEFLKLYPGIEFPPVIDGDFIKSDPLTMDISNLAKIPLLFGGVSGPGNSLALRIGNNFTHGEFLKKLIEDTVYYFPRFPHEPESVKEPVKRHFTDYNQRDNVLRDTQTLASAIGDRHFTCANNRFLDAVAADRPVYSFLFTEPRNKNGSPSGAYLFDDANYAFGNPAVPGKPLGAEQAQLSVSMIRSLVQFADVGRPTWPTSWPEFKRGNRTTLVLRVGADSPAASPLTSDVFRGQECGYWDHVLPCFINGECIQLPTTTSTPGSTTTIESDSTTTVTGTIITTTVSDTPITTTVSNTLITTTVSDTPITTIVSDTLITTTVSDTHITTTVSGAPITTTGTDTPTAESATTTVETPRPPSTTTPPTPPSTTMTHPVTTPLVTTPGGTAGTTTTTRRPPIGTLLPDQGGLSTTLIVVAVVVPIVGVGLIGAAVFITIKLKAKMAAVGPV